MSIDVFVELAHLAVETLSLSEVEFKSLGTFKAFKLLLSEGLLILLQPSLEVIGLRSLHC